MFGDIVICQFPFTSGAASKIRPALVLFDLERDAIVCRVTGVLRTGALDENGENRSLSSNPYPIGIGDNRDRKSVV